MRGFIVLVPLVLVACGGAAGDQLGGAVGAAATGAGTQHAATGQAGPQNASPPAHTNGAKNTSPAGGGSSVPSACWPYHGGTSVPVTMTGVTAEADSGYDRLIVQFDNAVPSYQVSPNATATHFTGGGQSVTVAGTFGVLLQLSNVSTPPALLQNDVGLQSGTLQEANLFSASQSNAAIGIGLSRAQCPRITTMVSPPRLIIDFPS